MKKYIVLFFLLTSISINAQYQLPVIKLNGNFGYDYQEGTVSIYYTDGTSEESLTAKLNGEVVVLIQKENISGIIK